MPARVWAVEAEALALTASGLGLAAVGIFAFAYLLVALEEFTLLRKSKPMILAAGIIWVLIAVLAQQHDVPPARVQEAVRRNLVDYAELLLFLLAAMTYVNAMMERGVFAALRAWLVRKHFNYRQLFWLTGVLAFFLSPVIDNLTTALVLGSVVLAVGVDSSRFVRLALINIVVAANAGGAFSPFGDITTLMIWQANKLATYELLHLFIPAAVAFGVPMLIMTVAVPRGQPAPREGSANLRPGAITVCLLFLLTIATAVSFEHVLHLPPFLGMMVGLGYLMFFGFHFKRSVQGAAEPRFDIFNQVARAEWDTLLFFFGVIFCVGGLGYIGYLQLMADTLYTGWGPTRANITAGIVSSVIDNIPVMFGVLRMDPDMSVFQWKLICLTVGAGGSLLSIGSAAGVALMGQARGTYTFLSHLKWSWAIALGYAASIAAHFLLNGP